MRVTTPLLHGANSPLLGANTTRLKCVAPVCTQVQGHCSLLWSVIWVKCTIDCELKIATEWMKRGVHNCDYATVIQLWCDCNQKYMFIFLRGYTRLQPITAQEYVWAWSTSCGFIVYCYFRVFRLINKGNLLLAVIFLFNHVDFIRYGTCTTYEIDVSK